MTTRSFEVIDLPFFFAKWVDRLTCGGVRVTGAGFLYAGSASGGDFNATSWPRGLCNSVTVVHGIMLSAFDFNSTLPI